MTKNKDGLSFYFFDFDDNIMFLSTPIYILDTFRNQEKAISTGDFANIHPHLGKPGKWENYTLFDGSYREFRDIPPDELGSGQKQHFIRDVEAAVSSDDESWKAPSWPLFVYVCEMQRPVSIITARGHSPETLKAGVRILLERNLIAKEPNYLSVFPVGNEDVRRSQLGDAQLTLSTPVLKKVSIIKSVEEALQKYGQEPGHRFGMSDDDPKNVNLIISAMTECKKRYLDKRFFAIDTHFDQKVKLEVFPVEFPVTGTPVDQKSEPLE